MRVIDVTKTTRFTRPWKAETGRRARRRPPGLRRWGLVCLFGLLGLLVPAAAQASPSTAPSTAVDTAPASGMVPAASTVPAAVRYGIPLRTGNWAGYVAHGATFQAASASWKVPAGTCGPADSLNAQWVGIDGYASSPTVQQIGTTVYCHGGSPTYYAWYEMYGDTDVAGGMSVPLPSADVVRAGDQVAAEVRVSDDAWTLSLHNQSAGWSFSYHARFTAQQSSAEWILERPSICSSAVSEAADCTISALTPSAPVVFTQAGAATRAAVRPVGDLATDALRMVDQQSGAVLASPSPVSDGGSFTVTLSDGGKTTAASQTGRCSARPFTDVSATSPFCPAISWLKDYGIVSGYANGSFHPAARVSRAAMAAFLYRIADNADGSIPSCTSRPFRDVSTTSPFCGAISWMKDNGIATGYADGTFRPEATVTRAAMAAFLYRAWTGSGPAAARCQAAPFPDVTASSSLCGAIAWLKSTGIATGYADGTFRPEATVTRAAMAAFLYRWETSATSQAHPVAVAPAAVAVR